MYTPFFHSCLHNIHHYICKRQDLMIKFIYSYCCLSLCQVWLKLAQWFWRMYFRYFVIISPFEKGMALHLNKLESPLPKDALCQVWLKLDQWYWRRRFLKFHQCIYKISLLSLLGKECGPSLEETWIAFTQGCFVPSLVVIGSMVLEKKIFNYCRYYLP